MNLRNSLLVIFFNIFIIFNLMAQCDTLKLAVNPPSICGATWVEATYMQHITGECSGGWEEMNGETSIFLIADNLVVDLTDKSQEFHKIEADVYDNCAVGCTKIEFFRNGVVTNTVSNTIAFGPEVLSYTLPEGAIIDSFRVFSLEGLVNEIRLKYNTGSVVQELTGNLTESSYRYNEAIITTGTTIVGPDITTVIASSTSVTLNAGVHFQRNSNVQVLIEAFSNLATSPESIERNMQAGNNNDGMKAIEWSQELDLKVSPNPFQHRTTINYNLSQSGRTSLSLFNLQGQAIDTFLDGGYQEKGRHQVEIDINHLLPGTYFIKLQTNDTFATTKIILL